MTESENVPRGPVTRAIPEGDDRERLVCPDCGFVNYENPKVVVGAVVTAPDDGDDRVLLCRRAIPPRKGYWTLPAGYLELHESVAEGAIREAWEEARARIRIDGVLAVYSIPRISQIQVIHRAQLLSADIAAGPESMEVGLFAWEEIPWDDIAFPSVRWALDHFAEARGQAGFAARSNPPGETGAY